MTVIYLVRHGLVHDPQLVIYGRLPRYRLAPEGRQQAAAMARVLSKQPIAHVFSSPLLRARQTAKILLEALPGVPLHLTRLLHEVRTPYEGQPRAAVELRGWDLYSGAKPGYEQPELVLARGLQFVAMARRRYAGQHVVGVTHGDVIAFLSLWAHGLPPEVRLKERFFPATASITTLTFHTDQREERPEYRYEVPHEIQ